ncbi:centrosomal protein of 97 kDa-like [Bemisia tabaci]|uniref:centrosomal protein of 97 kDa-like n=1 Tax=Bemisia tabaci TaxID=7038 RepID=UPI003B285CC5
MSDPSVLNLSCKSLKKIPPPESRKAQVFVLDLHKNELPRLDNLEYYVDVRELNASHNEVLRMSPVLKLKNLVKLDLSHNNILNIEGLKDLIRLQYLNLSSNHIKAIEHLHNNRQLEYLNLSENNIAHISNISHLTKLKELHLEKNRITNLRHCELYLPSSITALTLAHNDILDLNEVSHLAQLDHLSAFSIAENPCVMKSHNQVDFDYRSFVINWCLSLTGIDGTPVNDLERLKAEWLYSQGRGRQYHIGEHTALVQYLCETCPSASQKLVTEQDRKLRLILLKAQQHQQQLKQEQPAPRNKKVNKSRPPSTDFLMTRSLDPSLLTSSTMQVSGSEDILACFKEAENNLSRSINCPNTSMSPLPCPGAPTPKTAGPLPAATTLLPVPESLNSPLVATPPVLPPSLLRVKKLSEHSNSNGSKIEQESVADEASEKCDVSTTSDVSSEKLTSRRSSWSKSNSLAEASSGMNHNKLSLIRSKALEKKDKKHNQDADSAATCIQKMWRGYQTRMLDKRVANVYQQIQNMRMHQYIKKLSDDMEATRAALNNEHRLQVLQMQAMNALWKKITSLEPGTQLKSDEPTSAKQGNVEELAETCTKLNAQVQQLQEAMQEVLRCVSPSVSSNATSTQTDIVAVHTPAEEAKFPYQKAAPSVRPSTLPLLSKELSSYANSIVGDVLKRTIEQGTEAGEEITSSSLESKSIGNPQNVHR